MGMTKDVFDEYGNYKYPDYSNSQYTHDVSTTGGVMMGMTSNEWELNERRDEYLRIGDIIDRFNRIDDVYGHTPWTLEQIYSNLNILVGKVVEDGKTD